MDRYLPEQAKHDRKHIKSMVERAETAVEGLFYRYEKQEEKELTSKVEESGKSITLTTNGDENSMLSKLHFE